MAIRLTFIVWDGITCQTYHLLLFSQQRSNVYGVHIDVPSSERSESRRMTHPMLPLRRRAVTTRPTVPQSIPWAIFHRPFQGACRGRPHQQQLGHQRLAIGAVPEAAPDLHPVRRPDEGHGTALDVKVSD